MNLFAPDLSLARSSIAYSDISSLNKVSDVEKAAEQFESVFVDMWLKSVREANKVFSEDNFTSSDGIEMHQEMLDKQWAIHIAENGGIGLKDIIVRQLRGQPAEVHSEPPAFVALSKPTPIDKNTRFVAQLGAIISQELQGSQLNPTAVTAQAVLETGWGEKVIRDTNGRSSFNLFGIKANSQWRGATVTSQTTEYIDDKAVSKTERFRAYDSFRSAIADYKQLMTHSERYADLNNYVDDAASYADALQQSGYATDPEYATKVKQVIEQLRTHHGFII